MNANLKSLTARVRTFWARHPLSITTVLLLVTAYLGLTQNTVLWRTTFRALTDNGSTALDLSGALIVLTLVAIYLAGTFSLLALLCVGRMVRGGLTALLVIAVIVNYYMSRYGAVIDQQMIVNATRTNWRETRELLSLDLLGQLLLFAGLPSLVLWQIRFKARQGWCSGAVRTGLALAFWGVALGLVLGNYKANALWGREHSQIYKYPNPVYPIGSAIKLAYRSVVGSAHATSVQPIAQSIAPRPAQGRRRVVVMVVGETARADHFSLYGYPQPTNPQLSKIPDLLRFAEVRSCGTATAVSVPCMFSRHDRSDFDRQKADYEENLLDVIRRAGVDVLWRDNNVGCQGVCARVGLEDLASDKDPALCRDGECFDEILLRDLPARLRAHSGDQLIVLHQLGSHGPSYYRRYPDRFANFQPACVRDEAYRCDSAALINAYDNTIVYTDHVLAQVHAVLADMGEGVDTALVYVSDHGESLGENGLYLHGFPYALAPDEQTRVPMLVWLGSSMKQQLGLDWPCAEKAMQTAISHDQVFDLLLGLLDVQTDVYQAGNDRLRACRSQP
ncbi:phosphoethanolamine transferase [Sinimarinibacterium sp. NLF-5-8]|uniref:phosphoethanolamine transferase n=1 Tax=Sinimarinibacterium sp. NLF-5-8 TaxID=2698684 RepID=UPI00137BDADB|nr:phosphoethanolamine--lipid A transferase [Sinimarinibacterium sp. NLF-5-8]QHS09785.1 phosphoethanolamine transferase [Sinimarinibacterium sp. NLF-5-8]